MRPPIARRLALRLATTLLALLTLSAPARAGVFDLFGVSARDVAMAQASTGAVDDHTATFLNPAALTQRKEVHLGVSFLTALAAMDIEQPRPPDARLYGRAPSSRAGVSLGAQFPFGGRIDDRVALGLVLYIPTAHVLATASLDPQVPRWALYNSAPDKLHLAFGLAFEVTDWLSVGVGAQALAAINGDVSLDIDLVNDRITRRDMLVQIVETAAPIVGVEVRPVDGLRIGAAWRGALGVTYELPLRFDLGGGLDLDVIVKGSDLYTPHVLSLGGAWSLDDGAWLLAADARLWLWSRSPDPSLDVTIAARGPLLDGLGLGDALVFRSNEVPAAGFHDALSLHLGAEHRPLDWLTLRGGYAWRQAHLPAQTGPTSYLDSDAHILGLGAAATFPDPLEINDRPVTFELAAQLTLHPEQSVERAAGDPLVSLTYGGLFTALAATVRHDF